jgi:hypothetical protein
MERSGMLINDPVCGGIGTITPKTNNPHPESVRFSPNKPPSLSADTLVIGCSLSNSIIKEII